MTGQEILIKAQELREIQLKIREKYPEVQWPEPVMEPMFYGRFEKTPVFNRKLMMDMNTGIQYDIVSDRYELIPHELAAHNLLQAIPLEFGAPKLRFNMWADGARFRLEATFPDIARHEIVVGDPVEPKIIQTNSLDRSTFYGIEFGANQLVCSNGMVAYKMESKTQRRHILGATDIEELTNNLKENVLNFSEQVGIWQNWAQINIKSDDELELTLDSLKLSDNDKTRIKTLPLISNGNKPLFELIKGGRANLWDVNSALTQFTTHDVASEQKAFELERRIAVSLTEYAKNVA